MTWILWTSCITNKCDVFSYYEIIHQNMCQLLSLRLITPPRRFCNSSFLISFYYLGSSKESTYLLSKSDYRKSVSGTNPCLWSTTSADKTSDYNICVQSVKNIAFRPEKLVLHGIFRTNQSICDIQILIFWLLVAYPRDAYTI